MDESYKRIITTRLQTGQSTRSSFNNSLKQKVRSGIAGKKFSVSINFANKPITYSALNRKHNGEINSVGNQFQSVPRLYRSVSDNKSNRLFHSSSNKTNNLGKKPQLLCSAMCCLLSSSDEELNCNSNQIILQKNCHQKRQIASLTKIMTAFTVINICNSHGVKIREAMVTVEKQASMMEGTSANLRDGDKFLIIDLLFGLLLPSGNDAALALAQYFGKFLSFTYSTKKYQSSIKNNQKISQFQEIKDFYDQCYAEQSIKLFVFEMNKNCQKIQLKNTRFSNPTGLADKGNYSTAFDIAKLISFCMKNHILRQIFKKKIYSCTAINQKLGLKRFIEWRNTNKHLFQVRDCIGGKTGITPTAGPCLSTVYKVKGREIIVVILNSGSLDQRYSQAFKIFHYVKSQLLQQKQQII